MKILFVSQYFWPESFRGNDVAFELARNGHQVTVFTGKPNYPKGRYYKGYGFLKNSRETYKGVDIIRIPVIPRFTGKAIPLALNYFSFVFFSFFACKFRLKSDYDVIIVQQLSPIFSALPGIWVKQRISKPLILWVLDLWPDSFKVVSHIQSPALDSFLERTVNKVYKHTDHFLISSSSFRSSIKNRIHTEVPITYFPNWAEDVFSTPVIPEIIPELTTRIPPGFNIAFAGNIGEAQDFESIVKAAELTMDKGINWIIIGSGRKFDWLQKMKMERKVKNIHLLGNFPIEKMPELFGLADVMLVSLKDNPLFAITVPAKIQAYMASGKIILGMLNGEGAEVIRDAQCGFVVGAGDYAGLAQKAVELSGMPGDALATLRSNSKKYYLEYFEKNLLINRLEKVIAETIRPN